MKFLTMTILILLSSVAFSQNQKSEGNASEAPQFPQDELAKESVLPKFDNPITVKNRLVVTAKKMEVIGFYGLNLTEPIFGTSKIALGGTYHLDENRGVNILFHLTALNFMRAINSTLVERQGQSIHF
jgi:hypothetical protein